jgi:ATP-dependent DNA helicase PIF1
MTPSDATMPKFTRRQFPIKPAFGITINKSQGQTLQHVGIFLPQQVFSHGQLYVAMSRVGKADGLRIMATHPQTTETLTTKNVVYEELLT